MDWCAAIRARAIVEFNYDGHRRLVVPAAFGNHATSGNPVLRSYQIGGTSSSRVPPLWDLFLVTKIVGPSRTGRKYDGVPPDYRRGDKHIDPIICEL